MFALITCLVALSVEAFGQDLITSTALIGGTGGTAFSDKAVFEQNDRITALKLCIRSEISAITGIQAKYGSTWAPVHGGCGGVAHNIEFQANETITKVDIGAARNSWVFVICHINIYTNVKSYGPYKACETKTTYELGAGLKYLTGAAGNELDSLTLFYERTIKSTAAIGGPSGSAFSDETVFRANGKITALKFCIRQDIKSFTGVQATYGSTLAPVRGGCAGEVINVALAANEVITKMDVGAAHNGYYTEVCYIKIYTNVKIYGPYKGCDTFTTYELGSGLAYLSGRYGSELDNIVLNYYA